VSHLSTKIAHIACRIDLTRLAHAAVPAVENSEGVVSSSRHERLATGRLTNTPCRQATVEVWCNRGASVKRALLIAADPSILARTHFTSDVPRPLLLCTRRAFGPPTVRRSSTIARPNPDIRNTRPHSASPCIHGRVTDTLMRSPPGAQDHRFEFSMHSG
jgi:hypothetical protein